MRAVVWLILLFVVAVVAATTLGRNDGLVSLYWNGWRFDMSMNLFVVSLLLFCFVLIAAMQALGSLVRLPARAREWRALRRERAAQTALREALGEYLSARYSRAHKAAQRVLTIHDGTPELASEREIQQLSHLLSAASLHRLQDRPGRDEQSRLALQTRRPDAPLAGDDGAHMMAAEWAVDDRDPERALAVLAELPPGVARRTQALRLKLQAHRMARQPLEALRTARLLAKHQGFSGDAATGLLRSLAREAINASQDLEQLRLNWQQLDPADRNDAYIAARAARRAAALGAPDEARTWLRPLWNRLAMLEPDERTQVALALIAAIDGIDADWVPALETVLAAQPQDSAVAAAVGSAFAERQLWGKARPPLELAAADPTLNPAARRHAWRRLAHLAREEGDEARSITCEHAAAAVD
jgi:HemY protein